MVPRISPRIGVFFGITGAAVWIVLFLVGVARYPGYSMTDNWVSDLGNPRAPAPWTLNVGCILAGFLFIPFAIAAGQALGGPTGIAGIALFILAAAFLVGVGVFPEESPNSAHGIVSIGFFVSLTIALALFAAPLYRSEAFGPVSGILSVITVVIAIGFAALSLNIFPDALAKAAEHATIFAALTWVAWNAWRLYSTEIATPPRA